MAIAYTLLELVALAYVFRINSRPGGGSYKLGWTLLILTVPVVGLILYWLWNGDHPQKRLDLQKLPRPRESDARQEHSRLQVEHLRREHPEWGRLAAYLDRQGFPLYTGTGAVYLPTGEAYLEDLLERMEQAEHFIFMEFYIMAEGQLWDRLMDIFRRKAGQGVEIKVLFDDFGSMMRMSEEAVEELRRIGAEVLIFNPVHHYVNRLYFNYRDHRKIACIDGDTAYTGGANIADEYANLMERFGYWKDDGIRLEGQGANPDVDIYRYVTEQTFDAYLYQLVEGKQKFASQIMTSKSPVRSAEDIDETALSYAEIKMLATGNPYIKEKMDLDIQVQKLKLLKSNFLSERYALEDKIIKYYPQRITALENRIEGLKQDVETAKQHPKPTDDRFVGMEVKGVFYSEKADAGKAIIEACKQMNSPDPIPLGKYRGFETELLFNTAERNYEVRLKGATSRNVPLGDDAHGNIIRLDNGIERFAESLSLAENDLENTKNQLETAKKEVQKPFIQEEELKTKLARLDELNILLNMDKRENEIVGGEPDEGEVPNTRKEKTYER